MVNGYENLEGISMDGDGRMENGGNIIELVDEDEKTVRFEHLMTVEYEGDSYVLLSPIDEVEGLGEDEVVILKIEEGEENDTYVGVEDEELLEKVFERYLEIAEADEDELEADEDEEDDE